MSFFELRMTFCLLSIMLSRRSEVSVSSNLFCLSSWHLAVMANDPELTWRAH